jgi:hypothetical protein
MPYTSLTQARESVTNPLVSNGSTILYGNSNNLNTGTTFYTDKAKTILAPAGNYVVATNYKTYYVTLGSNGMMTTSPQELMQGTDTNWVDDLIKNGDANISNWISQGGTSLVLNGMLLTDNAWTTRPYPGPKAWIIDVGTISTSPITNIDLSDMKGYDLRLITGEYVNNSFVANDSFVNTTSAIIHLAPDPNRASVIGNMKYFFRPDYWIPTRTYNQPSFYRRMPTIEPILKSNGAEKMWIDMAVPLQDVINAVSHTVRQSTRLLKGITQSEDVSTDYGYTQVIPRNKRLFFDGDNAFRTSVAKAWNVSFFDVDMSDLWQNRVTALVEAHNVDEADRSTWRYIRNGFNWSYSEVNPYSWTWQWGSGTALGEFGLCSQFLGYWDTSANINAIHHEYDFEYLASSFDSEAAGVAWNRILNDAKRKADELRAEGIVPYVGSVNPQFSAYGNGIYQSRYVGAPGYGWESMEPGNTITNTRLYSDYNDYYINGTITYQQTAWYKAWFKGSMQNFKYQYVTNYQLKMNDEFQMYSLVHNTDISRKAIDQIMGVGHDRLVCAYFWYKQEPIAGADFVYSRHEVNTNGNLYFTDSNRLEVCPSQMYNFGIWSMAYADGLFMWWFGTVGEENGAARATRESGNTRWGFIYGECNWVGKSSLDWAYVGYFHAKQNDDIISANTQWLVPDLSIGGGAWTTGTANYPVSLYNMARPLARYKLSADGTEALVLIYNGFGNSYTKSTFTYRLPAKNNYQFTVDCWGNFTTVIRLKNL